MKSSVLLSGTSNRPLALKVARRLRVKLANVDISTFANTEIRIQIRESVKNKIVFIIQPTNHSVNDSIIELGFLADAARQAGAKKVIALVPWFGYSPQDKVFREGEPLSGQVIVRMLEASGIDEFVVVDAHSDIFVEMFSKPVTHLSAMPIFIEHFCGKLTKDWCVVALDTGAKDRAREFANALNLEVVQFDKTRDKTTNEVTFHALDGDVEGKKVISFDDFTSSGGTRIRGAEFLKNVGAVQYYDCVTHLLVPAVTKKFKKSMIDKMFVTDTLYIEPEYRFSGLKILSVAPVLAEFIKSY